MKGRGGIEDLFHLFGWFFDLSNDYSWLWIIDISKRPEGTCRKLSFALQSKFRKIMNKNRFHYFIQNLSNLVTFLQSWSWPDSKGLATE